MYRQSSNRNQRSKGIRVKNVLQICLLLAVCFWLIYQIKHSHDKKKEFEETDSKVSRQSTSGDQLIKFGRKDIRARVDETDSKDETHDETSEEEETTGDEVEENMHDEDESEDKKLEAKDENEAEDRDVETVEHEQEKSDVEIDREQGLVDGEEREDGEESETQETDSEEHGQTKEESTIDDTDHDTDDKSSHEAREEHYKADDASSAVTHDQIVTENENEQVDDSNEHPGNNFEAEKKENGEETYENENRSDSEVEGSEAAGDGHQSNVTTSATEEDTLHDSEKGSTLNKDVTEGSTDHLMSNNTTELTEENNGLTYETLTTIKPEIDHSVGNVTDGLSAEVSDFQNGDPKHAINSIINVDGTRLGSNSTDSAESTDTAGQHSEELSDSSDKTTDSSASEDSRLEASTEEGNANESSPEKINEFNGEKSDSSDGTDESLESMSTDNPEEAQEDAIDISDTSISVLDKDIRTDLDTLPEIQTEGSNSEDVAAE